MAGISLKEAYDLLSDWYDFTMDNPDVSFCPTLVSEPGIGKTSIVEKLAKDKGVKLKVLILSQAQPSEVAGMAMPNGDNKIIDIYDPGWADEIKDGDILFFDEVYKAPTATLNSCLTMIQSRIMASGRKLPNVAIIAAANPVTNMGAYAPEVKQRFIEIPILYRTNGWVDYIMDKYELHDMEDELLHMANLVISLPKPSATSWNCMSPRDTEKALAWCLDDIMTNDWREVSLGNRPQCLQFINVAYGSSYEDAFIQFGKKLWDKRFPQATEEEEAPAVSDTEQRKAVLRDIIKATFAYDARYSNNLNDHEWMAGLEKMDELQLAKYVNGLNSGVKNKIVEALAQYDKANHADYTTHQVTL